MRDLGTATPTLPRSVDELPSRSPHTAANLGSTVAVLARESRDTALALRRLVWGDLAGMFAGPTTPGLDLSAGWWCRTCRRCATAPRWGC